MCWIIDTAAGPAGPSAMIISQLLLWLFTAEEVELLGFSFNGDLDRLSLLTPELVVDGDQNLLRGDGRAAFVDIQKCAVQQVRAARIHVTPKWRKGDLPGLKLVAETWLRQTVDKSEQCSSWADRPLREAQLLYGALDAMILVRICRAMYSSKS
eukprot:SAG31_NODE_103_length_25164_cov_12.124317_15_plen_154_part_00